MNIRTFTAIGLAFYISFMLTSCASIPENAEAVSPFDAKKYLGKWYEIARLDFKYEENLNNTTAQYSLNSNNTLKVVNRGYNYKTEAWEEAQGKAKFVKSDTIGMLKVSFFGPFYSGYNIIALDKDYNYALVAGRNLDYLWILSRKPTLPESIKQEFLAKAKTIGYNTDDLIWVAHDKS